MKIIEFNDATCLFFEKNPPWDEEPPKENICGCGKNLSPQKNMKKEMLPMKESLSESDFLCDDGILLPFFLLELAEMKRDVQIEVYDGAIIGTQAEMNVLELLQVIESLEDKIEEYHRCLFENFIEDKDDEEVCCDLCNCVKNDCVNTSSLGHILLELGETGEKENITHISEKMLLRLVDMGLCLEEINYAILEDEIVYYGRNL